MKKTANLLCCFVFLAFSLSGQEGKEKLYGINYGPFIRGLNPQYGNVVPNEVLHETLKRIQPFTGRIRTFGSSLGIEKVGKIATEQYGLKIVLSAWLSRDLVANDMEIKSLLSNARYAEMLVVGSETLLRGDLSPQQLVEYLTYVKAEVKKQGLNIPVTTADTWNNLKEYPEVREACEVLFPNIYPFWEKVPIEHALQFLQGRYEEIKKLGGTKPTIISETGWPSDGAPNGSAIPSLENAANYFQSVRRWARENDVKYFFFEGFDEKWKTGEPGGVGLYWGMFYDDFALTLKPGFEIE